jgi:hypothetical protein
MHIYIYIYIYIVLILFILYLIHLLTYAHFLFLLKKFKLMFNIKHDYIIDACHEKSCVKMYDNILHIDFIHNSKRR